MALDDRINVLKKKRLRQPVIIAAWPGMGLVGFNAVEFLRQTLGAEKVAEIHSTDFFSLQGVTVKEGISAPLKMPTNVFYAWRNPAGAPDLLLFLGTAQPVNGREMALSNLVLDVAAIFGVTRLFTAAAMASKIDHLSPSKVYGVSNEGGEAEQLDKLGVELLQEGEIGGLNGLLIGVAEQRNLQGSCLMGEMPHYTTHIENPKASQAVLEILMKLLDLKLDLKPLQERARYIQTQIQGLLQEARDRVDAAEGGRDEAGNDDDSGSESPDQGGGPAIN